MRKLCLFAILLLTLLAEGRFAHLELNRSQAILAEETGYAIRLVNATTKALSEIDWANTALVRRVSLVMPDGRTVEGMVLNDPRAGIQETVMRISELLKDGKNNPIKDNNGSQLAKTDKGEVVVVREGMNGAGELVGKYDWGLVKRYFQHIQEVTGRAVGLKQIDKLKDALRAKEYTKLSKSDLDIHRADFNKKKNALIKEWEIETGQEWPKYTEPYYTKNGELYKKVGDPYDAHHIIENQYGGNNEWWNMHPAKFPDEHQGGIHGTNSPSKELFK